MHEASALVAGATLAGGRGGVARRGDRGRSTSPAGCTTRCRPGRPASASTTTRRSPSPGCSTSGAERIAYVDIDVHHGDGVQDDLLRRPAGADGQPARVAADAVPRHRLPGRDRRAEGAEGSAVNVALPPGTDDRGWLRAFHAVVPSVLRAFRPAGAVHPVRRRHAPPRPARRPAADRRRAARRATWRCGRSPTSSATAGGSPPAAAATRWSRWCPRTWTHLLAAATGDAAGPGDADPAGVARAGRRPAAPAARCRCG